MQRVLARSSAAVLALAVVYAATLVPGVRPATGYDPIIDGWLNGVVDAGVLVVLLLRARADPATRAAWLWISAALACALLASVGYYAYYQFRPETTSPTASDVGWLAFYPLLYVGLLQLLRSQVRRMWAGVWLDGVVAGLSAAAVAVAYVEGAGGALLASSSTGLKFAYPAADLVLFGLGVAALAMLGRVANPTWWLICASFVVFAVSDWAYAEQVAAGTYVAGGPLDLGWLVARLALLAAAWTSLHSRWSREGVELDGGRMLLVPGVCALAALGVLFHGTTTRLPVAATVLALVAGVTVVGRTFLTLQEIRTFAEVKRQAHTDELTGLHNRRHFFEVLRPGGDTPLIRPRAVLLLDLDRFKEVNDSLGHHAGDELLCDVGRRLRTVVADHGVLARLGGDEYAIVLAGATEEDALAVAGLVRSALRDSFRLDGASVVIDGTIGIALEGRETRTGAELLQMADLALYAAKRQHHGVQVYDEARDGTGRHRLQLVAELRAGIQERQLVLHYQPQVDLRTGAVAGVEALIRWQHPSRGLLGPAEFIAVAESAGLMGQLTRWVADEALAQWRRWDDHGVHLRVAVNVSPSALVDRDFSGHVQTLLRRHGVPGSSLVLEVTEDLLMDSRGRTVEALSALRVLGVGLSIDDYGTGYSSLAYLKDLPVTELKLDRSFVASMGSSPRSASIVHSTVELAHALGLDLVAEGVEDADTRDALVTAGCDLAQGYLLGQPMPADDVAAAVARSVAPQRAEAS